jgi:hypothetical protein
MQFCGVWVPLFQFGISTSSPATGTLHFTTGELYFAGHKPLAFLQGEEKYFYDLLKQKRLLLMLLGWNSIPVSSLIIWSTYLNLVDRMLLS